MGINGLQLYLTEWSDGGNSQEDRESGQNTARYDECEGDVNMRCGMTGLCRDMVKYESRPVLHLSGLLLRDHLPQTNIEMCSKSQP